jgi:hypothetical protein
MKLDKKLIIQYVAVIIIFLIALLLTSIVKADEKKISELEKRISQLESNKLSIPKGLFITGEVEAYYDDRTYDSGLDSRAELQIGITHKFNNHYVNWTGASMLYDTYYSLDTTLNNTVQEKQMGFGNDYYRLYLGETDAQRLGFAKTPKVGAPLIITQTNSRLDHREKTVLAIGGFNWDDQFDFDSYRLRNDLPLGLVVGWDNERDALYTSATVGLFGYADLSYMQIKNPKSSTSVSSFNERTQQGWSLGGSLYRWDIPLIWGAEIWDDKDTGFADKNRYDYGVLYSFNERIYGTVHRTENDDLGFTGNYYGLVYNIHTEDDKHKRPDKRAGLEFGLYYHDKEQTSVYTGVYKDYNPQLLATIRYKF